MHFKVSPSLQVLFGEVLAETAPTVFRTWWDDAEAYARREAEKGSSIAVESLKSLRDAAGPSAASPVFHHFGFASVGRRDSENRFLMREMFYSLPSEVYDEYRIRLSRMLSEVASDIFEADS